MSEPPDLPVAALFPNWAGVGCGVRVRTNRALDSLARARQGQRISNQRQSSKVETKGWALRRTLHLTVQLVLALVSVALDRKLHSKNNALVFNVPGC